MLKQLDLTCRFIQIGMLLGGLLNGCMSQPPLPTNLTLPTPRPPVALTPPQPLIDFQTTVSVDEQNYQLGAGDEITIEVWGHPELSGKHLVGPDGKITLPLVGPFLVTELTREQAAQMVTAKLSLYYTNLSTILRVDRYASNRILVLGRVAHPGEVQFGMTAPTLLEAISLAGGFAQAHGLESTDSLPFTRCAVFRGRGQVVWVELAPLFTGKDLSLNLKLQRNDIVYIPELEERLVYVLGEVHRPGAYRLTPSMSFMEALAKAGGPTVDAAPDRMNLIRPQDHLNQSLALSQLISPNQKLNVGLQEGDVIYIPTNTIAKINYAVRFLSPFSTILGIYADIESVRADRQQRSLDKKEEQLRAQESAIATEKSAVEQEKAANSGLE